MLCVCLMCRQGRKSNNAHSPIANCWKWIRRRAQSTHCRVISLLVSLSLSLFLLPSVFPCQKEKEKRGEKTLHRFVIFSSSRKAALLDISRNWRMFAFYWSTIVYIIAWRKRNGRKSKGRRRAKTEKKKTTVCACRCSRTSHSPSLFSFLASIFFSFILPLCTDL